MTLQTTPEALPRVGGMATMPSRVHTLSTALERILGQVDCLYLYLDRFDAVPAAIAAQPKIVPILSRPADTLRGAGKFIGLELMTEPCLYFCFDDDILYARRYVQHLATALYRYSYKAIVGIHATILKSPYASYIRDRAVLHFNKGLAVDCVVDELGTGTLAFHSGMFHVAPRQWAHHDMCDLLLAIDAVRQEIPRICIQRPDNFLLPIEERQPDSIWMATKKDDSRHVRVMRQAIEDYPLRWCNYSESAG